jgi:hypothetical protein
VELEGVATEVYKVFQDKKYLWKIDGKRVEPSYEDIFDTMAQVLGDMRFYPDGARFEIGRLIFQKTGDMLDIYVLQGTIQYDSKDSMDFEESDNQGDAEE